MPIFLHPFDIQFLYCYLLKTIDNLTRLLMNKIMAAIANTFVYARHNLARFPSLFCPLLKPRHTTLSPRQCFFVLSVKARIVYVFAIAECCKTQKSNIYPYRFAIWGERHAFYSNGKACEPFPVLTANRASLDLPFNMPMNNGLHNANFR
ncbi:hypothetical protein IAD21_03149 [Abditibacteriota bacterium]|nr:hypothetical protein IAD21_03149 [Abditibacteriota bacterium]